MTKIYDKWRELAINPLTINFKNIVLKKIISYPPAGNDVLGCICSINNVEKEVYIKFERSKMANFTTEEKHLNILYTYYKKIPKVYEFGTIDNKKYIVLEKIEGERLSDIFNNLTTNEKHEYLMKYGQELAKIHQIPCNDFDKAMQRIINDYPKKENYKKIDNFLKPYIEYLIKNKIKKNNSTFIHGDFHYANILWNNKEISGVLDFEYSGKGFKEQDIAWACILRPTQYFMDCIEDIKYFLKGYLKYETFDEKKLRWCLINCYCHFYLMNINNKEYINKLKKLMKKVLNKKIMCF